MSPSPARLAAALLCLAAAGCAGSPEAAGPDADQVRSMLVKDSNGLEIRQIVVADEPDLIAARLGELAQDDHDIDPQTLARLRENGFRLLRVPVDQLDQILDDLGGASLDITSWQGQVYDWRDVHELTLGPAGRTIAIDGRVRRYEGGVLRLMARGWVMQMERGPRLHLDLVPQHYRPDSTYRRLLNQPREHAQPLPSLAVHLLLELGYAYILTCESPQRDWSTVAAAADHPAAASGPSAAVGPAVQAPSTLGELMLSSAAGRPSRGMLVFIARISPELFPESRSEHALVTDRRGQR